MKLSQTLLRLATPIAVAALLGTAAASAQRCDGPPLNPEQVELRSRIASTLGSQAIDYWVPKLNNYREQIDQALSPADLENLRRLRVRWAILVDQGITEMKEAKTNREGDRSNRVQKRGKEMDWQEMMTIFMQAKEIATRYRPQMDQIGEQVVQDVGGFGDAMRRNVNTFTQNNRAALEADPEIGEHLLNTEKIDTLAMSFHSEETQQDIRSAYSVAIEPIIMLFDGNDLISTIQRAVPGANLSKATEGIELPSSSALRQNFPNPASAETTIPFVLTEPATAVTLRLYNQQGDVVRTEQLGAMGIGEHTGKLDVKGLPAGSYLYHLTVVGANGQRVHAKSMQVVK